MATQMKWAKGMTLTRDGHLIAELDEIGAPKRDREMIPSTTHDSADDYEESLPGFKKAGEISISGNFIVGDTDGQIGLHDDFEAGTLQSFVITYPPAITATWTFTAYVKSVEMTGAAKDKIGFKATLAISGKPTLAIGASAGLTTPFLSANAGTLNPAASGSVYDYVLTEANGVTSVILTPTAAAGVITITANGVSQTVISGAPATAIALGAAGSLTNVVMTVKETGKVAKVYNIVISRAA